MKARRRRHTVRVNVIKVKDFFLHLSCGHKKGFSGYPQKTTFCVACETIRGWGREKKGVDSKG
jgi:hypothetical protein